MSAGFVVVHSRPFCDEKVFPAFGSACPPETLSQPKRNSLRMFWVNVCVSPTDKFTECVLKVRPNPGKSASFRTLEPKGSNWFASKTDARPNTLSFMEI